jgi:hypothetical protein
MAKTRRKKINKSPARGPYRNSKVFIAAQGDRVSVKGVRGRTKVSASLPRKRYVEEVPQIVAKPVGDRRPKVIWLGRQYTGVARSKPYPARGVKRGGIPTPAPGGLMARAAKAVKRVVVSGPKVVVG